MNPETYASEAAIEETHWWFIGRRKLFRREINRLKLSNDAKILDVGTSTGTNLRLLKEAGFVDFIGLDASVEAVGYCNTKKLGTVLLGDVCDLPFDTNTFNLVIATDLLEHIDQDARALKEIIRVVQPGGHILFTVPAFKSLWGLQDEVSHHKRRYSKSQLNELITGAGLSIERTYYFNFLLFTPIWLARQSMRILKSSVATENDVNTPALNMILKAVFELDCYLAPVLRPSFGVSVLTLASKSLLTTGGCESKE